MAAKRQKALPESREIHRSEAFSPTMRATAVGPAQQSNLHPGAPAIRTSSPTQLGPRLLAWRFMPHEAGPCLSPVSGDG